MQEMQDETIHKLVNELVARVQNLRQCGLSKLRERDERAREESSDDVEKGAHRESPYPPPLISPPSYLSSFP